MLKTKLIFLIISLFLILPFVNAETGTVSIASSSDYGYVVSRLGITDQGNDENFTFDTADYNSISYLNLNATYVGSTCTGAEAISSSFTIVSGGSGSGTGTFYKYGCELFLRFSSDTRVLSSPIKLSYTNATWLHGWTIDVPGGGSPLDSTHPVYLYAPIIGRSVSGYYNATVSRSANVNYVVTYNNPGFFNITITKSPVDVTTRIRLEQIGNSTLYMQEGVLNKNNWSADIFYQHGLAINVSVADGTYVVQNINLTNMGGGLLSGTGGSSSGQIYFDYGSAVLSNPYGINVSLLSANWTSPFSPDLRINVYEPTGTKIDGFPVDFSLQYYNTSRLWTFDQVGTYNATLTYCTFFDVVCKAAMIAGTSDGNLLDTASLTVNQFQYNYAVNTNANSYSTGDVVRFTITNPSPSTIYFNVFSSVGGQNPITNRLIPNGTSYVNMTVTGDMLFGSWEGALYTTQNLAQPNTFTGKVASKTFSIGNPAPGTKVSIRWDVNNLVGQTNTLYYTTNQNPSIIKVWKVLPGSSGSTLVDNFTIYPTDTQRTYLMDTPGLWNATVVDTTNASNTSSANLTVVANLASLGCNKNLPDYVCWDKSSYVRGDAFLINYKVSNAPLGIHTILLTIYDPDGNLIVNKTLCNTCLVEPITANFLQGTFTKSFSSLAKVGKWKASIVVDGTSAESYNDGTQITYSYATVADVPNAINATSISNSPRDIIDGWTALFGWGVNDVSRFFFAILFIAAGMFAGFILAARNLWGGVFGAFVPFVFFTYIDYVPKWIVILIAIVVGLKLGWFR